MLRRSLVLAALIAATATGVAGAADMPVKAVPKKAPEIPYFLVNENSLSYHYEFKATEPGNGYTDKHVGTFTHFDVWAYGTNLINIDYLKSVAGTNGAQWIPGQYGDPTGGCAIFTPCTGRTEIYGFIRSTLGFNELSHSKMFSYGPLKNISFAYGADFNTENGAILVSKKSVQAGLQFDFATPFNGNLSLNGFAYKEWSHNQFVVSPNNTQGLTDFNVTWGFGAFYVQPIPYTPTWLPLTFKNIVGLHGPKGSGINQIDYLAGLNAKTKTELFEQATLDYDIGKVITGKANMWSVWGGFRFWHNKFGIDPNPFPAPGPQLKFTVENTWLTGTTWAF